MNARRDIPIIILWYGPISHIPFNWQLCDGSNGSPDLRNRFVVGAGDSYAVSDTGGAVLHNHDFTGDGHTHTVQAGFNILVSPGSQVPSDPSPAIGTTDNVNGLAPYHSLSYIMWTGKNY